MDFVEYVQAEMDILSRDALFKVYLTDCLAELIQLQRSFAGIKAKRPTRFYDLAYGTAEPEDNRSGEEIAVDIISRAGLTII